MPYIEQKDRSVFEPGLRTLEHTITDRGVSNGELNYLLTRLCLMYLARHGTSYNTISDAVKAMECAKLEFYRRVAAPYEDAKIKQNGDVYLQEACNG